MTRPAPPLRTDRESEDFHALMAAQLRSAPWLLLSAALHAALLVALWLLLPAEARPEQRVAVTFAAAPEPPPLPPEPPPLPPPVPQEPTDLQFVELDPVEVDAVSELDSLEAFTPLPSSVESAFDSNMHNTAIGIAGGAAGPGGGGPHGRRRGGGGAFQPQVRAALDWLVRHQDEDGRWDCDGFMKHDRDGAACDGAGSAVHDVGVTGLALLAFLGEGTTLRQGEYREPLRKGVQWLLDQQDDSGRFGGAAASDFVYDHAIAAYAIGEACGLSEYRVLRAPAERAYAYLAAHRNPYGAWRYQPRDGDSDTSVTGWCTLALASGKSLGLTVDDAAVRSGMAFLESCTDAQGRTGYTSPGELSSRRPGDHGARFPPERGEALTAVALFCRWFTGQDPREVPAMQHGIELLQRRPPVHDPAAGSVDHYYWYYGTYAMYQAGGKPWREWSKKLGPAVVATQRTDGNFAGSWDPAGVWGEDGGRVYSTAILALTLQVHYRYGRLVR
ncbi:MAG: hypothetical protein AB7O97_15250 [Planctomycetota bacterium]